MVENEIKYEGGEGRKEKVKILMEKDEKWVSIVVDDNGKGIKEEKSENEKESLVRIEERRKKKGYGMGLSIEKEVMKLKGGEISIEEKGKGIREVMEFKMKNREVGQRE